MHSILGDGSEELVQMGMNSNPEYYPAPVQRSIYLIGSLRNKLVPDIANALRAEGYLVFDDWYAAGPEADDMWRNYEQGRNHNYLDALKGHAARHVFEFDKKHIQESDTVILLLPAGKSGHLELGYALGSGKRGFILLDKEPDRFDVMYCFATGVFDNLESLMEAL